MGQPTSVQLYSVRDQFVSDPIATLERLSELGFAAVEPYRFVDFADALAAGRDRLGFQIPTGHCRLDGGDQDRIFETAAKLGITTVIEPRIPIERWADQGSLSAVVDYLEETAARAAGYGLRLGYHNHAFELQLRCDGQPALLALAQATAAVDFEIDAYWAFIGGADPARLVADLGGRVVALHVKDGPRSNDPADQTFLGRGQVPLAAVLAAAPHALRVLEVDDTRDDVFAVLRHGLAYLNDYEEHSK